MTLLVNYKTIGVTSVGKEFPWLDGFIQPGDTVIIYDFRGQELNVDKNPEYKDYISKYSDTKVFHKLFTEGSRTGIRVTMKDANANADDRLVTIMLYTDYI